MKVLTVVGARPQFIKAGSVSREIIRQQQSGINIQEIIVHTGQHYDTNMSNVFFDEMNIPKPDYYLGIGGNSHGAMTGQMIEKIEEVIIKENPDWVMVYGDTNSTLAGALAAAKLHIKVAHIEAGLRSFNMKMPEEINRILTDRVSRLLFCPTQTAMDNLQSESIDKWGGAEALLVGDVMKDGAIFYKKLARKPVGLELNTNFVLCTIHRAENTNSLNRLKNIIEALNEISNLVQVVLPLHPRTKGLLEKGGLDTSKMIVMDPIGYLNMVWLIDNCSVVMTDSGGLQKEAFFFSKPCVTLRDETEWTELIDIGVNELAGADKDKIINSFANINKRVVGNSMYFGELYGNGKASKEIVTSLIERI